MKKPKSILEFPLVIKQVVDSLTVSSPDLSLWTTIPLPERVYDKNTNRYVTKMDDDYALKLGKALIATWRKVDSHIQEKKWAPEASDIKSTIRKSEKALSLPAFAKIVQEHLNISEDSIRRDIEKGHLKAFKTSGGHRRVSASELGPYLEFLKTDGSLN